MRFLAGILVGALGVIAYNKKDEIKENMNTFKEKAAQGLKSIKERNCATCVVKSKLQKSKKA